MADYFAVQGGKPLEGTIRVQGSKNAVLPILAACLLVKGETVLHHCPMISDVEDTLLLLRKLGCLVQREGHTVRIDSTDAADLSLCDGTASAMRSSVLFLGALLGRFGHAEVPKPGGCAIGARPIDLHLAAFRQMGVCCEEKEASIYCHANTLAGAKISLPLPSVGATENILLLAAVAPGTTIVHGAAKEPEVQALAEFLNLCGANIYGTGTDTIRIEGVGRLQSGHCEYMIPPDRMVAGTLLCAAAMTGGRICLENGRAEELEVPLRLLEETGCRIFIRPEEILLAAPKRLCGGCTIATGAYPAFPTDLQPLFMSLLTLADGTCMINETIFEARFSHALELCAMGADIRIRGQSAVITGQKKLHGACVYGQDLRAGAALLIAALAAEGESRVYGCRFLDRGYEDPQAVFGALGGTLIRKREKTII